jgi:hypothetical protein
MTAWVYYDGNGNRVREEDAAFKGKEVRVDSGAPAPPNHASLAAVEYHDVHAIGQPELRKTFKSFSKLKAWLKERAPKSGRPSPHI